MAKRKRPNKKPTKAIARRLAPLAPASAPDPSAAVLIANRPVRPGDVFLSKREHFLWMMPLLWDLRDERRRELAWEADFVRLVAGRLGCDEARVWEAVEWWKNKVIWKRPIRKDDAKALRMIERRLQRQLAGEQEAEDDE